MRKKIYRMSRKGTTIIRERMPREGMIRHSSGRATKILKIMGSYTANFPRAE